jgi:hypothetical protein
VRGSAERYIMGSGMICAAHQMLLGDQIENNEIGAACSAYGGKVRTGFWGETRRKETIWKTQA